MKKIRIWQLAPLALFALLVSFDVTAAMHLMNVDGDVLGGLLAANAAAATLPDTIKAELERIRDAAITPVAGLRDQVQNIEQILAKMGVEGVHLADSTTIVPGIGSQVTARLQEDDDFKDAAEAASRGMKSKKMACRINLDGSIRAALVNEGRGNVGDTQHPRQVDRNRNVPLVLPRLRLIEALPHRPVVGDAVEFIQVKATGDAAEQVKEGDLKAEIDVEGSLETASIATVAAWTSASKQVLSDAPGLASKIDTLVRYKVLGKLEGLLLNGVGGTGKILGLIAQATGIIPSIGATPADRIGESLVRQANDGYQPSLVVMNPLDWFRLQITRVNAQDDEYVFGSPTSPAAPSLWNTAIVATPHMTAGKALTLDTSFVTVLDREQTSVMVSTEHADFFIRNLVAILGELRAGLEVTDVKAVNIFDLDPP